MNAKKDLPTGGTVLNKVKLPLMLALISIQKENVSPRCEQG